MYWETFMMARSEYNERVSNSLERGRRRRQRAQNRATISPANRILSQMGQALVASGLWLQQRAHTPLSVAPPAVSRQNG